MILNVPFSLQCGSTAETVLCTSDDAWFAGDDVSLTDVGWLGYAVLFADDAGWFANDVG